MGQLSAIANELTLVGPAENPKRDIQTPFFEAQGAIQD